MKGHAVDFEWAFGGNRRGYEFLGIWPVDEDDQTKVDSGFKMRWRKELKVPTIMFTMFFAAWVPQAWALVLVIRELPLVLENLMSSVIALAGCIKLYFLRYNQATFRQLLDSARKDWENQDSKPSWQQKIMRQRAASARLITIIDYIFTAFSTTCYILSSQCGFKVRTINNITDCAERHLVIQSYYPFDYCYTPIFLLTFASQCIAGTFMGISVSVPEKFFVACAFHVGAQFEILAVNFRRLFDELTSGNITDSQQTFKWRFRIFVHRHVHLIAMIELLENFFGYVLCLHICSVSIVICSASFRLIQIVDSPGEPSYFQVLVFVGFVVTMLIQTFIECFASGFLSSKSQDIFDEVYNSKWYNAPYRSTRDIMAVFDISRNPRQVTAGKILPLDLPTFCTIVKSLLGYISVLLAVTQT